MKLKFSVKKRSAHFVQELLGKKKVETHNKVDRKHTLKRHSNLANHKQRKE